MKFIVSLLLVAEITLAQTPISEVRKMKTGRTVTVAGVVTVVFDDLSFIQDHSGGIAIYNADVRQNDSILITGKLAKFNSMLEIIADSVTIVGQTPGIDATTVKSISAHEGEIVRLNKISLHKAGLFFYPKHSGFGIFNQDTIHYWIDESTDIPGYTIPLVTDLTGVVGRFGKRLQLLPRLHTDITNSIIEYPISKDEFQIMNWNVEFFGAKGYGPVSDSIQIVNVAKVLNTAQPDVVALQEVSNDQAFTTLLSKLTGYSGRCSSRYSYSYDQAGDFPPQKLCFLYKDSTVSVIREKILFRKYFDEHPSDLFSSGRLPYMLQVQSHGKILSIVNIHAKSGNDHEDYSRRREDAQVLKDSLDQYSNIILLGDFNDDLDTSIVAGYTSPYSVFNSDDDYFPISKTLSENGWRSTIDYDDMIDHQIISSSLGRNVISTEVLNVFAIIDHYPSTTSDHVPVISQFTFDNIVTGADVEQTPVVYPNPTDNNIWFRSGSTITIFNSLGEIIIKKEGAYPPISVGEYAPGLYVVRVNDQVFRIIRN